MARNETGAMRANASAPGVRLAAQLDTPKDSAAPGRRPPRAASRSILSVDHGSASHAAAWLARRARVSLGHAAALAEAHGIGDAA